MTLGLCIKYTTSPCCHDAAHWHSSVRTESIFCPLFGMCFTICSLSFHRSLSLILISPSFSVSHSSHPPTRPLKTGSGFALSAHSASPLSVITLVRLPPLYHVCQCKDHIFGIGNSPCLAGAEFLMYKLCRVTVTEEQRFDFSYPQFLRHIKSVCWFNVTVMFIDYAQCTDSKVVIIFFSHVAFSLQKTSMVTQKFLLTRVLSAGL